jgi:hypothetical protein
MVANFSIEALMRCGRIVDCLGLRADVGICRSQDKVDRDASVRLWKRQASYVGLAPVGWIEGR